MILVTGATGNVGTHVLQRLSNLRVPVRALSRDPTTAASRFHPDVQWARSDLSSAALKVAFADVDTVVLITAAGPEMASREKAVIDAAALHGARRVVKLSGLGAGPEAPIRLPRSHHESETYILDSGLVSTFVRPNLFFQTLLGAAESIANDGAIYAPAGDGATSFTDARDVADVIVTAATSTD